MGEKRETERVREREKSRWREKVKERLLKTKRAQRTSGRRSICKLMLHGHFSYYSVHSRSVWVG